MLDDDKNKQNFIKDLTFGERLKRCGQVNHTDIRGRVFWEDKAGCPHILNQDYAQYMQGTIRNVSIGTAGTE